MKKQIVLLAAAAALCISACSEPQYRTVHRSKPHSMQVKKVEHLKDGRWAYQDNTGVWWWFYYNTTYVNTLSSADRSSYVSSYSGGSSGGGSGGGSNFYTGSAAGLSTQAAVAGKGEAPSAQELAEAEAEEVTLDVMAEGEPAVETATEGATEVVETETTTTESTTSEGTSTSTGESSSSSSSSEGGSSGGGGGDSGGGGGGDGGGGGGGD